MRGSEKQMTIYQVERFRQCPLGSPAVVRPGIRGILAPEGVAGSPLPPGWAQGASRSLGGSGTATLCSVTPEAQSRICVCRASFLMTFVQSGMHISFKFSPTFDSIDHTLLLVMVSSLSFQGNCIHPIFSLYSPESRNWHLLL